LLARGLHSHKRWRVPDQTWKTTAPSVVREVRQGKKDPKTVSRFSKCSILSNTHRHVFPLTLFLSLFFCVLKELAMSGLEALGIVPSVLQIADVGARLSVKLYTFSHKLKNADTNVQNISSDVAMACTVLRELGETLEKDEETKLSNHNAVATTARVISECRKIFTDLEEALDGSQCDAGGGKGTGKGVKFSFAEPQIELLRCNLERLKSTLLLMLNVIIYAGNLRRYGLLLDSGGY
jgi:hypothetical protein